MPEFIEPADLAEVLAAGSGPVVLDVRWTLNGPSRLADYTAGHLPGAVFCDLDRDLAAPVAPDGHGGRHPLPAPAALQRALRRWRVRAGRPVVVYDDGDLVPAARAWWVLGHAGLSDVRVLAGGWAAWVRAGLPVQAGAATHGPAAGELVYAEPVHPEPVPDMNGRAVLTAEQTAQWAAGGQVLDARSAERFRGESEPVDPVAGHIPGAASLPVTELIGEDGRVLPPERIRSAVARAGADPDRPVGAYCGSGVSAALTVLALHTAGVSAALYPGSWSDWVSDPTRPVATG